MRRSRIREQWSLRRPRDGGGPALAHGVGMISSNRKKTRLFPLAAAFALAFAASGCAVETGLEEEDGDEEIGQTDDALSGAYDATSEGTQAKRINDRRARLGRRTLTRRSCLNSVARRWSYQMASRDALAHNPNLAAQVSNKCGAVGLRWRGLAENVGVGYSELSIWRAFIDSDAHRGNIDRSAWDSMGIGIYKRSDGKLYVTQVFADF